MKRGRKTPYQITENTLILLLAFFWNIGVYSGVRLITGSWPHYDMTTCIDELIPFVPWTVWIYFGCYLFWVVNYVICVKQKETERDRFFCADFLAKGMCLLLFLLVPTTNVRPVVQGETIWDMLMRLLYQVDSADNLFPSIHCIVSWLCWIGVRKRKDIPIVYRVFSFVVAAAVCVSTLTTKQHVIMDVFVGIMLAEVCYYAAGLPKVVRLYSGLISKIKQLLKI